MSEIELNWQDWSAAMSWVASAPGHQNATGGAFVELRHGVGSDHATVTAGVGSRRAMVKVLDPAGGKIALKMPAPLALASAKSGGSGKSVKIDVPDDGLARIFRGSSTWTTRLLDTPGIEFPSVSESLGAIGREAFTEVVSAAAQAADNDPFAAGGEETLGVQLIAKSARLSLVGMTAYRTVVRYMPWEGADFEIILPAREMAGALAGFTDDSLIDLWMLDSGMAFTDPTRAATVPRRAGKFQPWQRLVDRVVREQSDSVTVSRGDLLAAGKSALAGVGAKEDRGITLRVVGSEHMLVERQDETGSFACEVPLVEGVTPPPWLSIYLNGDYMRTILAGMPGENMSIAEQGGRIATFTPEDSSDGLGLVALMRWND